MDRVRNRSLLGLVVASSSFVVVSTAWIIPGRSSGGSNGGYRWSGRASLPGALSSSSSFSTLVLRPSTASISSTRRFMSGNGIAKDYTWHEEAFELEVTVSVPHSTRASDIIFKATSTSIDLRLKQPPPQVQGPTALHSDNPAVLNEQASTIILLDPQRPLRGRVAVDGTFWVLSDADDDDDDDDDDNDNSSNDKNNNDNDTNNRQQQERRRQRKVTVTIEKQIRSPKDDFDVIEYDWKGVYLQEEKDEVTFRKYDVPEFLNPKEYAASLGVDIDNINMSMVDKTMFSSGLNLTKSSLQGLQESGWLQQVTKQADGSEWITDKENGDPIPFVGMEGNTKKPMPPTPVQENTGRPMIPFLDTDSPWHKVPVSQSRNNTTTTNNNNNASEFNTTNSKHPPATTTRTPVDTPPRDLDDPDRQESLQMKAQKERLKRQRQTQAADPIETLTVTKLKEILRRQGLKVSGNKQELQDRLRAKVNNMLQQQQQQTRNTNTNNNNNNTTDSTTITTSTL